jgi:hypothetical protein
MSEAYPDHEQEAGRRIEESPAIQREAEELSEPLGQEVDWEEPAEPKG